MREDEMIGWHQPPDGHEFEQTLGVGDDISAIPFSFCLQSFLASGSFPVSQLFASGGQNIGTSASEQSFQ